MGNAVGARVGGSTPPDRARELTHWFCYQDPGVGDDPFDLHPSYAGGTRVEAAPARRRQFGAVRLAAGFAAAALRREVWAVPPWLELTRHRVLPPAPRGDTSPAEIADRLEQAILAAVGDEGTVAVTVSGGVDSAALLWMVGRICQRDGRRLVPIVLDMEDDQGGSPVTAAGLLLDAMGLGDPLRVVPVKGRWDLPGDGHEICPLVAMGSAQWRPPEAPGQVGVMVASLG